MVDFYYFCTTFDNQRKNKDMEKKRVLFVSQEITPYLPETELSKIGRYLPQGIQERGKEIRAFMPKFGKINERRNQLHEVIRLSGMNLIIDDTDHPLIIKVASIQAARMQVYFIDNEDYFQRKFTITNKSGEHFEDNDERAIFFARGVLETIKKLRWAPDLIHCHGWMTALVALYAKKAMKDDPLFNNTKVVYSMYNDVFDTPFSSGFKAKSRTDGVTNKDVALLDEPTYKNLIQMTVNLTDGIVMGHKDVPADIVEIAEKSGKPILAYQTEETYIDEYNKFYDQILG